MRTIRYAVTAAIVVGALEILIGQPPATPGQPVAPGQPSPTAPRTPPRATRLGEDPSKGTATLRGFVVAAESGSHLRRAMVRATSQDGRSGGMTTTDADGRWEIKELLAGRYSVSAMKAGFVMMQYGQRRPESAGTMLEILDGQLVEKIILALPRGGVITGRVSDEFGDPIAGAQVSALRFRYMNGSRRLTPSGGASTDDLGAFRMYGLAPGEYYVSGAFRTQTMAMPGMTTTTVEGYAPTYYPGTPNAGEGVRVAVKVGQETAGIAFALAATRLVHVGGRAVSSTGESLAQSFVSLAPVDRFSSGMMMVFGNAMTRGDGSFQIAGIAPGTYNLTLRPRGQIDANTEFGQTRVTVGAQDVDNLLIVTSRGAIARGIITTDENTPPPMRPQLANVGARPVDPEIMMMAGDGRVNDDWSFELSGLFDQRLVFASLAESPDWTLRGIYLSGQDITDTPIDFVPGHTVEGLLVVFSRKRTDLSGTITDDRGRPDTDATVVMFAEDSRRWTTYASRFVRTARPSQDGRYNFRGMPPEDYLIVAVRDLEPGRAQDPEFLESLRDQASRVSLSEGETKAHDLKILKQ